MVFYQKDQDSIDDNIVSLNKITLFYCLRNSCTGNDCALLILMGSILYLYISFAANLISYIAQLRIPSIHTSDSSINAFTISSGRTRTLIYHWHHYRPGCSKIYSPTTLFMLVFLSFYKGTLLNFSFDLESIQLVSIGTIQNLYRH